MPGFQFLSLDQLEKNIDALLSKVEEKHKGKVATDPRSAHVALIKQVRAQLKYVTHVPNKEIENEANKKARKELHAQWQAKIADANQLADIDEKTQDQIALLNKINAEELKLRIERNALSKFKKKYRSETTVSDVASLHILNDQDRAVILTGMLLSIKKSIENVEYGPSLTNKLISAAAWISGGKNDASNSVFFRGVDEAIGNTGENKIDEKEAEKAIKTYNQYVGVIEELKAKLKQMEEGKVKLKHVETKVKQRVYGSHLDHVLELDRGDVLLDTAEEKARYKKYTESQLAYSKFKSDINPLINESVQQGLKHVDVVEKHGVLHTVTDEAVAKLPNGKPALNKTIRDNVDPTHYMNGVTLPPVAKGDKEVKWTAEQEKSVFAASMSFFAKGGLKQQIESQSKLKHVVEPKKPEVTSCRPGGKR